MDHAIWNRDIPSIQAETLCETHGVLKRLSPGDEDYQTAVDTAIKGRCLADIKRDNSMKVRAVKQGFREKLNPGDTYTGHVVSPISVRSALANHKEGNMIAIIDVSTAFLQSNKFPEGKEVQPLLKGTPFKKSCIQCNESFLSKEERYKRCGPCQTEWRKMHPYVAYPGSRYANNVK